MWQPVSRLVLPAIAALLAMAPSVAAPPLAAQEHERTVLQGIVADQISGALIDSATITLVGTGLRTKTSDGGLFVFPEVRAGIVSVKTEAPGYPPVLEDVELTPGVVIMQIALLSEHAILEGFFITAHRPAPRESVDARTAADILERQVPGISTKKGVVGKNDSQILLRGVNSINLSSEPMLFIDGVRMSGGLGQAMDVLSHMPATDVKQIRILRGVSAAFIEGAANGVIFVETKNGAEALAPPR